MISKLLENMLMWYNLNIKDIKYVITTSYNGFEIHEIYDDALSLEKVIKNYKELGDKINIQIRFDIDTVLSELSSIEITDQDKLIELYKDEYNPLYGKIFFVTNNNLIVVPGIRYGYDIRVYETVYFWRIIFRKETYEIAKIINNPEILAHLNILDTVDILVSLACINKKYNKIKIVDIAGNEHPYINVNIPGGGIYEI